jgi:hypothetical protein
MSQKESLHKRNRKPLGRSFFADFFTKLPAVLKNFFVIALRVFRKIGFKDGKGRGGD